MTDVIFSGSKSRSPLNVASVSLTFDNSDNFLPLPYSEVTIKRRVYKSGEGEYFINGENVDLKTSQIYLWIVLQKNLLI